MDIRKALRRIYKDCDKPLYWFKQKASQKRLEKIFQSEFMQFSQFMQESGRHLDVKWEDRYPCLYDRGKNNELDPHYLYHTAWAARILKKIKPVKHIDISSYIYFSTIVSAFFPVEYYEYRPVNIKLNGLRIGHANLTNLPFEDQSIPSLSCMHVIEHIGLGRYGDPLDPLGDIKSINELKRVTNHKGYLIIVVPIGIPKIQFNAHRIYSYDQIIEHFSGFELLEFSLLPDKWEEYGIVENASKELANSQIYGCGCFLFRKDK